MRLTSTAKGRLGCSGPQAIVVIGEAITTFCWKHCREKIIFWNLNHSFISQPPPNSPASSWAALNVRKVCHRRGGTTWNNL